MSRLTLLGSQDTETKPSVSISVAIVDNYAITEDNTTQVRERSSSPSPYHPILQHCLDAVSLLLGRKRG